MGVSKEFKLRRLERQLEDIAKNPKDETVADYAQLQKEYSALKYQIETEKNLRNNKECVKAQREAVTRLVTTNII